MCIFNEFISCLACPKCFQCFLFIDEDNNKREGLTCQIIVKCDSCDYAKKNNTSQTISNSQVKGMKPFEINYRVDYALRNVASGYSGLKFAVFCTYRNL